MKAKHTGITNLFQRVDNFPVLIVSINKRRLRAFCLWEEA